jgi:hypothetical protein
MRRFSRLPHGFWDCLAELNRVRVLVAEQMARVAPGTEYTADKSDRLGERARDAVMPEMGFFNENFIRELLGESSATRQVPATYAPCHSNGSRPWKIGFFGPTDTIDPDAAAERNRACGYPGQRQTTVCIGPLSFLPPLLLLAKLAIVRWRTAIRI